MRDKSGLQGEIINASVTNAYDVRDVNCAKATMLVLSEYFEYPLAEQVLQAGTAMNGAGRYQAQCGLVEGALMFMGIFFGGQGQCDDTVCVTARNFAGKFEQEFGSLSCRDLRPGGFQKGDPKHFCKPLTIKSINFVCDFIKQELAGRKGFALKPLADARDA